MYIAGISTETHCQEKYQQLLVEGCCTEQASSKREYWNREQVFFKKHLDLLNFITVLSIFCSFTDNAGLCGIPGLPACGPHLSSGAKVGIAFGVSLAFLLIVACAMIWWKRRQNILRAQQIAGKRHWFFSTVLSRLSCLLTCYCSKRSSLCEKENSCVSWHSNDTAWEQ